MDLPAQTRFKNDQARAKRGTMPLNQMAQQSIRNSYNRDNPNPELKAAPRMNPLETIPQRPVGQPQQFQGSQQAPQGQPEQTEVDPLDEFVGQIRTQHFLESPEVKDAVTSIKLRQLFNKTNPPDPRPLMDQVVSRLGH